MLVHQYFLAQATQKQPLLVMTTEATIPRQGTSSSQSSGKEDMKEEAALIRSRFMDAMNVNECFSIGEVDRT